MTRDQLEAALEGLVDDSVSAYVLMKFDQAAPAAAVEPAKVVMRPMTFDDGRKGWYIRTPDFYLDIEHDSDGKWSAFFCDSNGSEAFADQAATPAPDAAAVETQPGSPSFDGADAWNAQPTAAVEPIKIVRIDRGDFYQWGPADERAAAVPAPVDERQQFEAWYGDYPHDLTWHDDNYDQRATRELWEVWQARAALPQSPRAAPSQEVPHRHGDNNGCWICLDCNVDAERCPNPPPVTAAPSESPRAAEPVLRELHLAACAWHKHSGEMEHARYALAFNALREFIAAPPAAQPACSKCYGRRFVEEGDPETGGNMVPCACNDLAQPDAKDAARYRWLRSIGSKQMSVFLYSYTSQDMDVAIDAAIAAAQEAQQS